MYILPTLQGNIFRILQYLARKLRDFVHFKMLFRAVLIDFVLVKVKTQSFRRDSIRAGYHNVFTDRHASTDNGVEIFFWNIIQTFYPPFRLEFSAVFYCCCVFWEQCSMSLKVFGAQEALIVRAYCKSQVL